MALCVAEWLRHWTEDGKVANLNPASGSDLPLLLRPTPTPRVVGSVPCPSDGTRH